MVRDHVTVHRTFDGLQADLLAELLRQNGIAARVLGTRNAAAIGVGQSIAEVHIEVPAEQAGEATDFLEAYYAGALAAPHGDGDGDGADADADAADDDGDDGDAARPDHLSHLLAGGAVLIPFGGSHLYARRYYTAALIATAQIFAILQLRSNSWPDVATGMVMVILLPVFDAIGGQLAVAAHNRGIRRSSLQQLAIGAALVAVAAAAATQLGPRIEPPRWYVDPYAGSYSY
jgi:hypothetical protein